MLWTLLAVVFVRRNLSGSLAAPTLLSRPLAAGQDASITLPPAAFAATPQTPHVGVYFALYHTPVLFPLRSPEGGVATNATRTVVASSVLATTVSTDLLPSNITPPVQIQLRLTGISEVRVQCILRGD